MIRNLCFTVWREVDTLGVRHLFLRINQVGYRDSIVYNLSEKIKSMNPSVRWVGDARLFLYEGNVQLVFDTGHSETPNRVFISTLDRDGEVISNVKEIIKIDGRNAIEKNWNFFVEAEKLYAIYSHNPLTILELLHESEKYMFFRTSIVHRFKLESSSRIRGEIRGTSTPVLSDQVYISATHSSFISKRGLIYQSHFFVFQSTFPFRPISFSSRPIRYGIGSRIIRPRVKLNPIVHRVEFPSGVFRIGKYLVIGFGLNDFRVGLKLIKISRVLYQDNLLKR